MMSYFKYFLIFCLLLILNNCSKIKESAGVTRNAPDEFKVIENPPLVIPPDFELVSPEQLKQKEIENTDKKLAEEILFGLEEESISNEENLSTIDNILSNSNVNEASNEIRKEIDETFANEMSSECIFDINMKDQQSVLDAVKESERIRENKFNNESITEGESPTIEQEIKKKKKKKRFILF